MTIHDPDITSLLFRLSYLTTCTSQTYVRVYVRHDPYRTHLHGQELMHSSWLACNSKEAIKDINCTSTYRQKRKKLSLPCARVCLQCFDTVGWVAGRASVKNMGGWWRWALVSPDEVAPSRMVSVSASVNLSLHHKVQKFSSGNGSPRWSWKKGRKMIVVPRARAGCMHAVISIFFCCSPSIQARHPPDVSNDSR